MLRIYCDGSTTNYCYKMKSETMYMPNPPGASHNESEYLAIVAALERVVAQGIKEPVEIVSDSLLAISQVNNIYRIRSNKLFTLCNRVRQLVAGLSNPVTFAWVPREQNEAGVDLEWYNKEARRK